MTLRVDQLKNITIPLNINSSNWSHITGRCAPLVTMYDILNSYFSSNSFTLYSDSTLSGNGTLSSPLKIAQQSATTGQVLTWNGTTWLPSNPDVSAQLLTLEDDEITLSGSGGSIPTGDLISADSYNALTTGSDGLLYVSDASGTLPTATTPGQIVYWTGLAYDVASEQVYNATPPNGTTDVSLPYSPIAVLPLKVFLNGVLQRITLDYVVSGNTITFITVFGNSPKVTVFYYR